MTALMRHILEDPATLQAAMEAEIRSTLASQRNLPSGLPRYAAGELMHSSQPSHGQDSHSQLAFSIGHLCLLSCPICFWQAVHVTYGYSVLSIAIKLCR